MHLVFLHNSDIFNSVADVLVCPTNAVGVMGNGLAKAFRDVVPDLFSRYKKHCRTYDPRKMVPFVFRPPEEGYSIIYCLHTKCDWRDPSKLEYIRDGLKKLSEWCIEHEIDSIAIPALGCGKGQLTWDEVKPLIVEFAETLEDTLVEVYIPGNNY